MKIRRLMAFIVGLSMMSAWHAHAQTPTAPATATKHFANGYDLLKAGDADSAVDEFKAGLKAEPNNATAWFYLGEARLKLGSAGLAKAAFEKSLALDPNGTLATQARAKLAQSGNSTTATSVGDTTVPPNTTPTNHPQPSRPTMNLGFLGPPKVLLSDNASTFAWVKDPHPEKNPAFDANDWVPGHLMRWTQTGGYQDLGSPSGVLTLDVSAISPDGTVVTGIFDGKDNARHVYRWSASGGFQDIATLHSV